MAIPAAGRSRGCRCRLGLKRKLEWELEWELESELELKLRPERELEWELELRPLKLDKYGGHPKKSRLGAKMAALGNLQK